MSLKIYGLRREKTHIIGKPLLNIKYEYIKVKLYN